MKQASWGQIHFLFWRHGGDMAFRIGRVFGYDRPASPHDRLLTKVSHRWRDVLTMQLIGCVVRRPRTKKWI